MISRLVAMFPWPFLLKGDGGERIGNQFIDGKILPCIRVSCIREDYLANGGVYVQAHRLELVREDLRN